MPEPRIPDDLHLGKPAERALRGAGFDTVEKVASASDKELLALHGVGRSAINRIREELAKVSSASSGGR
jgi:ERCC4-type nuclease